MSAVLFHCWQTEYLLGCSADYDTQWVQGRTQEFFKGGAEILRKLFALTKVQATLFTNDIYVIYAISILTHQHFSWPGPTTTSVFLCQFSPVTVILLIC